MHGYVGIGRLCLRYGKGFVRLEGVISILDHAGYADICCPSVARCQHHRICTRVRQLQNIHHIQQHQHS